MTTQQPENAETGFTPRHPTLLALAILCAGVVLLCFPMLAGRFLGGPSSDQTWTGIPFRAFWAFEFHRTGHIPLWNPYMFGGLPFVGAMHGDIFYPTSFLRLLLSPDTVLDIVFALHLVLAGLFTYAFLRTVGVSWTAAVTGGLAYQLSGIVASLVSPGHDGKLAVSALLPLLLIGLLLGIRKRRVEGFGLVALVVGLDLLSPQLQMTQYSLILAGLFTLWLCFGDAERPDPRWRWTSLGLAALAVAVGFGVAMIQLLPFIRYAPYAARTVGQQGWAYATSYAMPPENIVDWLVPTFTGILDRYWGSNFFKLHSEYVGAATLALAAVGVANARRRRLVWFLGGAAALFVLVALGGHTPFYRLWYALVPGVKVTRAPGMAFFIPTFAFACFAAFGVERLERGEGAKVLKGVAIAAGVLLLLGASGALGGLARALATDQMAQQAEANAGAIALGAIGSALVLAAVAWLGLAAGKGKVNAPALAALLFVLVGGDLFINARRFFFWSPPMAQLYTDDDITRRLEATPVPYRALDFPAEYGGGVYPTAFLMEKRIPNAFGHHGNELNAYDQLWGGKGVWANAGNSRLFTLLALRYLVVPVSAQVPGYHFITRVAQTPSGRDGFLYEADTIPPYARVVPAAVKLPDDRIVPTLLDPRLDFDRLVLLPEDAPVSPPKLDSLPPALATRGTVTAWEPGAMTVHLDPAPEHDAYLVVAENWYPDWHATVDGRPAQVLRGQHTLITVPVPRGAREVRLAFASRSYVHGKGITLASLGAAFLWLLVPLVLRRRRG
ncbi:MAG TPA: hypothetical protein VMT21_06770 [Gemmatimonadales bacterium]|nr:hypothetical protein [Gemmatimonadales bacterium]